MRAPETDPRPHAACRRTTSRSRLPALEQLVDRFDPEVFDVGRPQARIRVQGAAPEPHDVILEDGRARVEPSSGDPDAELIADEETWSTVAHDLRDGMAAFRSGRLRVRRDLHLGVGFLAATAPRGGPGRLRIRSVSTAAGSLSTLEAGSGDAVILIHGYLEEPHGSDGFWTRLPSLSVESLFVWGRRDGIVPARFSTHVREAVPAAEHLILDCGHVPQLERPRQTHDAIERFLRQ